MEQNGLVDKLSYVFLLNLIVSIARKFIIDPTIWKSRFRDKQVDQFLKHIDDYKKHPSIENIEELLDCKILTHEKVLEYKLAVPFELFPYYGSVFSSVGVALFYLHLFPLGVVYCIAGIIGLFYTSKVKSPYKFSPYKFLVHFDQMVQQVAELLFQHFQIVMQGNGVLPPHIHSKFD
jgi:hypothetical protein